MIVLAEDLKKLLRQRARVLATAGIGHGLTAASLFDGKIDSGAETSQHSQGRKPNLRIELIHVTRYEKAYLGHQVLPTS